MHCEETIAERKLCKYKIDVQKSIYFPVQQKKCIDFISDDSVSDVTKV